MKNKPILSITAILLLAAAFRIYHITQQSIWFDEAFAWNIVIQHDMYPRISTDTHPPLYYLLLRAWVNFSGESVLSLRYLSALISMLNVVFIYRVGRELVRTSYSVALLGAFMLALSDADIFLAQETRNYALYTTLATLSMWLYLRWIRKPSTGAGILWAGSTAALVYTHYQGIFIPAVQGLHTLIFLRGKMRIKAVIILGLSGVPVLPWFIFVALPQAKNAIDNSLPFAIPSNWQTFINLRNSYLGTLWALLSALGVLGIISTARHDRGKAFIVFMWFALPFGVLFFGNYYAKLLTERKLLIIAPALGLMVAYGLVYIERFSRGVLALVILVASAASVDYYRVKEPWDDITRAALPFAQPGDIATVEAGVGQYAVKYYWTRHLPEGVTFVTFPFLHDPTINPVTDWFTYFDALLPRLLDENKQQADDVATAWLVYWSEHPTIIERLEAAGYQQTMDVPFDHLGNTIHLYRYDYVPDNTLVLFENGMRLQAARFDAETLRSDLWFSTTQPLIADYTISVLLLNKDGQLVAQKDAPPVKQTSSWGSDEIIFDTKWLDLSDTLPTDEYTVGIKVYLWTPEGITIVPTINGEEWVSIGTIKIGG